MHLPVTRGSATHVLRHAHRSVEGSRAAPGYLRRGNSVYNNTPGSLGQNVMTLFSSRGVVGQCDMASLTGHAEVESQNCIA